MAFKVIGDYYSQQHRSYLLANSITVKVGDLVAATTSGSTIVLTNATGNTAGDKYALGIVDGFSYKNGEVVGQGQNPNLTPNQVTTASDNETVAQIYAVVTIITPETEVIGLLDAAAGTTALSAFPFVYMNASDCRTLDESTVVAADDVSAPLQFLSLGVVPGTTTSVKGRFAKYLYRK